MYLSMLVALSVYFIVICSSRGIYETLEPTTTTTESPMTKYNAFTIQWKPYFCNQNGYSDAPNCHNESIPNITIHGIWPNYFYASYGPTYCNAPKLQTEDVETVKDELDIYWPTLKSGNTNFGFWSYQWDKHGSCWTLVNATQYFEYAIDWMIDDGYRDIQQILAVNGIVASNENEYLIEDVNKALHDAFHQKITVKCKYGHKYISEFYACRDWFGDKIDCPHTLKSSCPDKVMLSLQVSANDYYTQSPTSNGSYSADDLMVMHKVQYGNSYDFQMFLLIGFIIVTMWVALKQWKKFGQCGYTEIKNNPKRKSMHHRVVMV